MGILRTDGKIKDDKKRNVFPTLGHCVANIRHIKENIVCEHCHKPGHKRDDYFRETLCNYCQKQGPIGIKESGKQGEGNDGRRSSLPNTKIASTESESESGPVEIKHIRQNNIWTAPCVTVTSPRLREAVTLMIDTGADINLIKIKKLAKGTSINTKRIVQLTGISLDTQKTLGTIKLIIFGEKTTFPAVDNHFPISADGIIGNEFLRSTPTNID
ncbi:hypothetical protein M0804_014135 [Polistes exclamans]|nr:hypothetical protein M0804_014135 [Polistes exclamans]